MGLYKMPVLLINVFKLAAANVVIKEQIILIACVMPLPPTSGKVKLFEIISEPPDGHQHHSIFQVGVKLCNDRQLH